MTHQGQLEKQKYRNWVRSGLAYKYLKEGIEEFAADVVQQEHRRILNAVNHTPGTICNQCDIKHLQPLHRCKRDNAGRKRCPWGQINCNCLYPNKRPCPSKLCDAIMEEILRSHGSSPPAPNWKKIDVKEWCTSPCEVAKSFINAPGYWDKKTLAKIDTSGLLHVFINNINIRSHFSSNVTGTDIFNKMLQRRNSIFHSASLEIEDTELKECIGDIISILEDDKELKSRREAQKSVCKLKQLKQDNFIITTQSETEVCRDALAAITYSKKELKQVIQEAKDDISNKTAEATRILEDQTQKALNDLNNLNESFDQRIGDVELEISAIKEHLTEKENKKDELKDIRERHQKQLEYAEAKRALQINLVKMYKKHYVKTSVSPLKLQENYVNIEEVYVSPEMVMEVNMQQQHDYDSKMSSLTSKYCTRNKPGWKPIYRYRDIFKTNGNRHKKIYIIGEVGTGKSSFCKMMIQNWCKAITENTNSDTFEMHHLIPSSDETGNTNHSAWSAIPTAGSDSDSNYQYNADPLLDEVYADFNEMRNFEFLFYIPLQNMSGLTSDITEMIKTVTTYSDLACIELVDKILHQDSERCLIIADGLDEWTPEESRSRLQHVSSGIPKRDRTKESTIITLSRSSAKGILRLKSSEYDHKINLHGINAKSVECFVDKYLSKLENADEYSRGIIQKAIKHRSGQIQRSPLLLQQLVWMYCTRNEIGKTVSDTYSHLVNIMLGWSQAKRLEDRSDIETDSNEDFKSLRLPNLLNRFPRCRLKRKSFFLLGKVAFLTLTSGVNTVTFGRIKSGLSQASLNELIQSGILVEENSFNPTKEKTQLAFIHKSYLEFFAAVFICSHYPYRISSKTRTQKKTILQEVIAKYRSAADILQLSGLLKMVCGLSPYTLEEISELVSVIARRDKRIIAYRNEGLDLCDEDEPIQIQRLITDCLTECRSCDKVKAIILDVVIDAWIPTYVLHRFNKKYVLSLNINGRSDSEILEWVTELSRLKYVNIWGITLPHHRFSFFFLITAECIIAE